MENIVQGNDVDFFISYQKDTDINETNKFLEIFKPKLFMRSDENYFFVEHYHRATRASWHSVMCMYLNRKNVNELFKQYIEDNKINYDLVISTRIDFLIHSKLNLDELYEGKKQSDINMVQSYNRIIERIHKQIKLTSRQKINNECCWYVVPEFMLGVQRYDLHEAIAYIIHELNENIIATGIIFSYDI
jgi:hypothetical protein